MDIQNLPHVITLLLWCLLIPCNILIIFAAPAPQRLILGLNLGQFLLLSFLWWYTWSFTSSHEVLINLLARLYMAIDTSAGAFLVEHWRQLASNKGSAFKQSSESGGAKVVPAARVWGHSKHLALTIPLLVCYWIWLIVGFTQLHLR